MTLIIKNPSVSDYFVEVSYKDVIAGKSGIAQIYESGKFILLRDYKFEIDYDFLNSIEQGDIWLADSRLISHQIYQGNRAIIYMFHIKPESMDNPEKRFNHRIAKLHEQQIK